MKDSAKYVIVAALEREIAGSVKGWQTVEVAGLKCHRQGDVAVVAVGMGWERASRGTKVVIERFHPELVTSIGFSGSLSTDLPVGSIFVPLQVVGSKNGQRYETGLGTGILVTVDGVVGTKDKAELASRYGASAVDMEAAAVAEEARAAGKRFAAIRAVSDGLGDEMDFVGAYVTPTGFRTGAFLAHVSVRPKFWGALVRLAENTRRASVALTAALNDFVAEPERFLTQSKH